MMSTPDGVVIRGEVTPQFSEILTPEAVAFIVALQRRFSPRRKELLELRLARQARIEQGESYNFLPETADIRTSDWRVSPLPAALLDRRVEITGPTERKMVINAMNSGAKVFMVDFEDANAPTWDNLVQGQINLRDAIRRTITFTNPDGKVYQLNDSTATLIARPRGWHMIEEHLSVDGIPISASLFDFGLYFFHNVAELLARGAGPYFYLPKLESHLEARLWNDVFVYAQEQLGIPQGSIKATVLIETLPAAFEMDEILYELREHSAGLNCGRWDYIFSCIKKRHHEPAFILPDRSLVTMTTHFMHSYSLLLIQTCHRRGVHAMGGMAAYIPIKSDRDANERALNNVRADKEREALDGHDGTWVAHPGLVPIALEVFDRVMPQANQLDKLRPDVHITAEDLLAVPQGPITEVGLRTNISVGLQYLEAWLGGNGCVPINNLMEDAATAEISRAQIWQWIRHPAGILEDGRDITFALFQQMLAEELAIQQQHLGAGYATRHFTLASEVLENITHRDAFTDFLTLAAYTYLI